MNEHNCRICGFYNEEDKPWGDDGQTPTFEHCPCCGAEFGYDDHTPDLVLGYRNEWINSGSHWLVPGIKPDNWDLQEQMKNIPQDFL